MFQPLEPVRPRCGRRPQFDLRQRYEEAGCCLYREVPSIFLGCCFVSKLIAVTTTVGFQFLIERNRSRTKFGLTGTNVETLNLTQVEYSLLKLYLLCECECERERERECEWEWEWEWEFKPWVASEVNNLFSQL